MYKLLYKCIYYILIAVHACERVRGAVDASITFRIYRVKSQLDTQHHLVLEIH